jgi:hypothetical protein
VKFPEKKVLPIKECRGFVTNVDKADARANYFTRMRGIRTVTPGKFAERDNGSKHRYAGASYPKSLGSGLVQVALNLIGGGSLFESQSDSEYDIVAGYDDQAIPETHINVYDTSWIDMTRKVTAQVNATPAATTKSVVLKLCKENGYDFSSVPSANQLIGWIAIATGHAGLEAFIIKSNTTCVAGVMTIDTIDSYLGTDGNAFVLNDVVELYPSIGAYYYNRVLGTSPTFNWMSTETQRKIMMESMNSASPPAGQLPILFMKRDARSLIGLLGFDPAPSLAPAGWYAEGGGGLSTLFAQWGDAKTNAIVLVTDGVQTAVTPLLYPQSSWLDISWFVTNEGLAVTPLPNDVVTYHIVWIAVLEYDGYQISDPIAYGHAGNVTYTHVGIDFTFLINAAKMPKNLTGIRIYQWEKVWNINPMDPSSLAGILAELKLVSPKDLTLANTLKIQELNPSTGVLTVTPSQDPTLARPYKLHYKWVASYTRLSQANLYDTLGHAYTTARTLLHSRYSVLVGQKRGSAIVVDGDDRTLYMTPVNGEGNISEDDFLNIPVDNYGTKLRTTLSAHGRLLGLGQVNNIILAMKPEEIEKIDLYSGNQEVIAADVVAPRSIIHTPFGEVWAGKRAIYIWEEGNGSWEILNKQWQNFYDGRLRAINGTQYLSDTQKESIVAGYDPTYYEVWFHVQAADDAGTGTEYLSFRYSFVTKQWNVRKLNIGSSSPVKWFNKRNDILTIGYAGGLLNYPNRLGAFPYHDDVPTTDANPSKGIETSGRVILGEIYTLQKPFAPIDIKVDALVGGIGRTNLKFYANRETAAFETKSQLAGERAIARSIPNHGRIETLAVEFDHSTADQNTITNLDISTVDVGFADVTQGDR